MILETAQSTDPRSFGERLERLRSSSGLELERITAVTKISRRVLLALEGGSFDQLPERVFSRAFVRQVAETLGCDAAALVADFDRAWAHHLHESGEYERLPAVEPPPRLAIRWRFWFPISVCGLLVAALSIIILSGSEPGQAALVEQPRRPVAASTDSPDGTAVSLQPNALPEPPASAGEGPIELRVLVDPGEECWVRYRDREGRTDQRLVPGGEALALELEGPVKLTVGNASAARILVDGVEYGGLGVPGQVVHAEVSRRGVTTLGAGSRYD